MVFDPIPCVSCAIVMLKHNLLEEVFIDIAEVRRGLVRAAPITGVIS